MSPEFLIKIIVRARNEIGGALERAANDINKVTKAQDQQVKSSGRVTKANQEAAKSFSQLRNDYDAFVKDVKNGKRSTDEAVFALTQFQREFEKLSRRQRPGSQTSLDLRAAAEEAKRTIAAIKQVQEEARKAEEERQRLHEENVQQRARLREAETESEKRALHAQLETAKQVEAERQADHERRIADEIEREQRAAQQRKALAQEVIDFIHERDEEQARNRKILADEEVKETARVEAARSNLRQDRARLDRAEQDADLRRQKRLREERVELQRVMGAYQHFRKMVEQGEVTGERARIGLEQHASRLRRGAGRAVPGSEMAMDLAQAAVNARDLGRELDRVGDSADRNRGFFARMFNITPDRLDAVNEKLREFEVQSNRSGFSAVRLAGNLRGMVIVGIIAFFQQLIGAGVSVAGVLVSVASAAAQGAAALAGLATAAVAQAAPALGLLAAAWGRVGAVFDALKAQQKAQLQASYNTTQAAERQRSAADSVRSAQEALADSQRAAAVAQENLTKARSEAVDQIQDLVAAEKAAQLQSEAARLSLDHSNQALRASIGSGDVGALAENSLQVRQDIGNVSTTGRAAFRARREARRAVAGGIEGMPGVVAARRAVEDANRSIDRAKEGLRQAAHTAGVAGDQIAAADRNLAMLLGDLSPAERRLFEVLERVRDRYRKLFTGKNGILEPITEAFTQGGERALEMLRDPALIGAARRLSAELGGQIRKINDFVSSPEIRRFYIDMADEATRNLPVFTNILTGIAELFSHIAEAGGPALRELLKFIDDLVMRADRATDSGSGMSKLEDFFMRGEEYAESIIDLTLAIGGLFVALTGAASEEGNTTIDQITTKIREATEWINNHQQDVAKFFRDARESFGHIAAAIWDLTKAIFSLFKPDQVKTFSDALRSTFIPALKDALQVIGAISHIFSMIAASGVGGMIIRFGLAMLILRKTLSPMLTVGGKLLALLGLMTGNMKLVGAAAGLARARFHPFFLIITALVSLFLTLRNRIHSVGDALKIIVPVVGGLVLLMGRGGLVSMVAAFASGLERIAAVIAGGRLGLLGGIFAGVLTKLSGILRLLPGVTAAAEGTAVAAGATTATRAARVSWGARTATTAVAAGETAAAAGAGGAAAGAAKSGLGGLLKKAAWIGVGISAAEGIISGFQHGSVKAGIQDFMHSITFGLVKSAEEISSEAAKKLNDKLVKLGKGSTGKNLLEASGDNLLASSDLNKDLKTAAQVIVDLRSRFNSFVRQNVSRDVFSNFLANLKEFAKTAPPEFKGVLDQMVDDAEKQMDRIDKVFRRKVDLASFVATFSKDLGREFGKKKPDIDKVIDTIPDRVKTLPPAMRKRAAEMAAQIAVGMAEKRDLPHKAIDGIRKDTVNVLKKMHQQANARTARMAADQVAIMQGLGIAFGDTLRTDFAEPVNDVLEQLGVDKRIKIKRSQPKKGPLSGPLSSFMDNLTGGPLGPAGGPPDSGSGFQPFKAVGGWIGKAGERGRDVVNTWLGRGELVLNHWQQRAVNAALGGSETLSTIIKRMRGVHAGDGKGFAGGGFVNTVGAHIDTPAERGIAAALARLGRHMGVVFSPVGSRSARRTPAENVEVGGSTTSNHLRGLAMDVAPEIIKTVSNAILNRFGLNRPMPGGWLSPDGTVHDERNHIELLRSSIKNSLGAISTDVPSSIQSFQDVVRHLQAPHATGDGAMSAILNGMFGMLTRNANRFMDRQARRAGTVDFSDVKGLGGNARANMALGKRMAAAGYHWVGAQWQALKRLWINESGWRTNADNPTSSAFGIPQALTTMHNVGAKYLAGDARAQIAWGLNYIKQKYGNPIAALDFWNNKAPAINGSHWYEKGGSVPGSGPVKAVLHGGEHVWTAAEVARAGGHSAMRLLRKLLGGGDQDGPFGYRKGGRVMYVSDSLGNTEDFKDELKKALGGAVSFFRKGGAPSEWGVDQIGANLRKAFKSVVFDMGTNDYTAEMFARNLRRAYKLVGKDRELLLPTIVGDASRERAEKNRIIQEFADKHGNVSVINWARYARQHNVERDEFGHTYGDAARTRARMFAGAVNLADGRSGGSGEGSSRFDIPVQGFNEIRKEINRIQSISSFFKTKIINAKFTDKLSRSLRDVVGDGGLLDRLRDTTAKFSENLARHLNTATFKLDKSGDVIQRLGSVTLADRTFNNLRKVYSHLTREQREISDQLAYTNNRLEGGKLTKAERAELVATQRNLEDRVREVNTRINDNLKSTYEALSARIGARAERAGARASRGMGVLDRIQQAREMIGGTALALGGTFVSGRVGSFISNQSIGERRATLLGQQAQALEKAAAFARRRGHGREAKALYDQIADLRQQILEVVQQGIQADAEEVSRQAGRRNAAIDLRSRIASALGRVGDIGGLIQDRMNVANDQIAQLRTKQEAARSRGFHALAEQIGDQISELETSVVELTAQKVQDSIDLVNNAAGRGQAALDLRDRLADLVGRAGNPVGAARARGDVLTGRGNLLWQQRGALSNILMAEMLKPITERNFGVVQSLSDQIAELDVAIQENTQAVSDNNVEIRQAGINNITRRGGFLGGVFSSLGGLVTALDALTGGTNATVQGGLLGQAIDVLRQTGGGLRQNLFEGFGVDVRGMSGMDLVAALRALNYDGIEANLSEAQRTQFEELINSIIENATAVETNTDALNKLNGSTTQSFSSTAWRLFRTAIFNGNGGLLSPYSIPSMGSASSFAYGSRGEQVVAANMRYGDNNKGGDTILQVTNPTEVLDPGYVAEVLHFSRAGDRAS